MLEEIDWEDVKVDRQSYLLDLYPTSFLPKTPAAKLSAVENMMTNGMLSRTQALSVLDYPDLEGPIADALADSNIIDKYVENMLKEEPVYDSPEPFMDLELCLKKTKQAYLRAKIEEVNDENLELLRLFMKECVEMMTPPQPPQQEPQQAPQQAPQQPPQQPPQQGMPVA